MTKAQRDERFYQRYAAALSTGGVVKAERDAATLRDGTRLHWSVASAAAGYIMVGLFSTVAAAVRYMGFRPGEEFHYIGDVKPDQRVNFYARQNWLRYVREAA